MYQLVIGSLLGVTVAAATAALVWIVRLRQAKRVLHHGDALALVAIAALAANPVQFDEELLSRVAAKFAIVDPQYATLENAATILAVLEVNGALSTENGVVALTHRGLHMRLMLAKGEPLLGLTAAFQRKRRAFSLTQAA
jgi:hypothetical protein